MTDRSAATESQHLTVLDSLRGICATFVVLFHFEGDALVRTVPFIKNAFLFVDFFFVLSGFVIAASYKGKIEQGYSIPRFLFLRIGRLYPLSLAVIGCYLVVATAKSYFDVRSGSTYTAAGFFLNVILSQVWIPYADGDSDPWNPVSWSISAEFWMYILFAAICRLTGNRSSIAFCILIILTLPILAFGTDRYLGVCYSINGFSRCVFGFSFGVLAYQLWNSTRLDNLRRLPRAVLTMLEILACAASLFLVSLAGPYSLLCPLTFSVAVILFAFERGSVSRVLAMKLFTFIGALSYSIYMVHDFLLARLINMVQVTSKFFSLPISVDSAHPFAIFNSAGWNFAADGTILLFYVFVVAVSWIAFKYVELPLRQASRVLVAKDTSLALTFGRSAQPLTADKIN